MSPSHLTKSMIFQRGISIKQVGMGVAQLCIFLRAKACPDDRGACWQSRVVHQNCLRSFPPAQASRAPVPGLP